MVFKKLALALAAATMALSGTTAVAQTQSQIVVPEHVSYMVVSMSQIIQQPNVVTITAASGESLNAALTGCNVEWRSGETWYFLQGGNSFYLIRKADLDMAYKDLDGNWDMTIGYLEMVGHICTATYAGR